MITLAEYVEKYKIMDMDRFLRVHLPPVLLHQPLALAADGRPAARAPDVPEPAVFGTIALGADSPLRVTAFLRSPATVQVFPLTKRADGAFSERVTFGRTRANDICLPNPSISKLHAYYSYAGHPSPRHLITDAGSTNGTFVNKRRLAHGESAELGEGTLLHLASLAFLFCSPPGLFNLLRAVPKGAAIPPPRSSLPARPAAAPRDSLAMRTVVPRRPRSKAK